LDGRFQGEARDWRQRVKMPVRYRPKGRGDEAEWGFTLLEVLVSLIIVGISFGVLFQALSQSKRIAWRADELLTASRIAHNLLIDSTLIRTAMDTRHVEGEVTGEDGWRFTLAAKPLAIAEDGETAPLEIPSMFEMTLCLTYGKTGRERRLCLTRWYRQ
jgi:prepilin-type N-terminal cleavage/methylation domain-containing protein